jgi:hypothetical protein
MQLPSASNTSGTALGMLAGAAVVAAAPSWPFIITGAAALGMTPIGLAGLAAVLATAIVNYGVTHFAEVKDLNGMVQTWWPQIQDVYPTGPNGQTATTSISKNNLNQG